MQTRLTEKEKIELFEKRFCYQYLTYGQLFTVWFWSMFNKKKYEMFFIGLLNGKSVFYSFLDAQKNQNN